MKAEIGAGMRSWRMVVVALAAAVLMGAFLSACGGGSSDNGASSNGNATTTANDGSSANSSNSGDAKDVEDRFKDEVKATKNKDFKGMYNLFSPRSRADCEYSDFEDVAKIAFQDVDTDKIQVANVKATVTGDSAVVAYVDASGDEQVDWVNVDGKWYDDNGGDSACSAG